MIGGSVRHSLSPFIHNCFALATQKPVLYAAISAQKEEFEAKVEDFWDRGGNGLNVTVPFKGKAVGQADKLSSMARKSGVLNVLHKTSSGVVQGYNTDGAGFVADIRKRLERGLDGANVLVVGAGGGAAGILFSMLEQKPASVTIANRTPAKAEHLLDRVSELGETVIRAVSLEDAAGKFDVVVNTTSCGHEGEVPNVRSACLDGIRLAYDLNYGVAATSFLELASKAGAHSTCDGLGMLVEQAALSYAIWENVRPSTRHIIELLSQQHV